MIGRRGKLTLAKIGTGCPARNNEITTEIQKQVSNERIKVRKESDQRIDQVMESAWDRSQEASVRHGGFGMFLSAQDARNQVRCGFTWLGTWTP